jgi:hypothetical protein
MLTQGYQPSIMMSMAEQTAVWVHINSNVMMHWREIFVEHHNAQLNGFLLAPGEYKMNVSYVSVHYDPG